MRLASLQDSSAASDTFFADLGTYLTLERAQRLYAFRAERCAAVYTCGLADQQLCAGWLLVGWLGLS